MTVTRLSVRAVPPQVTMQVRRILQRREREQAPPVLAPFRPQRTIREGRRRRRKWLAAIALVGALYGFLVSIFPVALYLYLAAPIILLAGLVIWALPESESYPAAAIEQLFFAVFLSTVLWPSYLAIDLPGLPWITMVRLWAAPLFIQIRPA